MKEVICIGSASKDIFFPTDKGVIFDTPEDLTSQRKIAFELGAKYQVAERFETVGGCAANVAYGLSKLGINTGCYTKIGDDILGQWILEKLQEGGVLLDAIWKEENCKSDLSVIIVDKNSGERTIFSDREANDKLEIIEEKISDCQWFFISSLNGDWQNNLKKIVDIATEKKIRIAFNPGQKNIATDVSEIIKVLSKSELFVVNKDEALEIVSCIDQEASPEQLNNEIFLLGALKDAGAKIVVITDGIRGAWAAEGEAEVSFAQALVVEALDTTGSGDAFTSGFFAALLKEKTLAECLGWGITNSSSSVKEYGGQKGLLSQDEIEKNVSKVFVEKIN